MSENKSAVVFRTNFLPYSETFIHDELRHHVRYKVTVLTKKRFNENLFPGHRVISLTDRSPISKTIQSFLFKRWFYSWTFNHEFSKHNIDIIHAHFATGGIFMIPFSIRYKLPLVVSLHGKDVSLLISEEIHRPKYKYYLNNYRQLFKVASLFLAASQDLKDIVVSCGCPEEKVIVYKLGIDLTKFTPKEHGVSSTHKVVMIGRLVEKKGFEFGIRAFAKTIQQGVEARLYVIGDGVLRTKLENLVKDKRVTDKVFFIGTLAHQQIVDFLRTSSVLFAPSVISHDQDRDSGLIAAKEAAACAIPVIGSIHGGIPDIVEDGVTGFLVKEKDIDTLSERLVTLLTDENLRVTFGKNGRKKMENEYDIRRCNERLEAIYDSLILKKN